MASVQALPTELFDHVVEHLVVAIGIQKAVLLRTVSKAFNAAMLHAICVRQIIDVDDPGTYWLWNRIDRTLKGKIIATKSLSDQAKTQSYLSVVAKVKNTLDRLSGQTDPDLVRARHECIAAAVSPERDPPVDDEIEAQNLLCGAAIVGDLPVLKSLLGEGRPSATQVNVNGATPYFKPPLTLAAAHGHLPVVRYLLAVGARLDSVASTYDREYKRLARQSDWNSSDENIQYSSLHNRSPCALRAAVLTGHEDIVHLLLRPEYRLSTSSLEYLRAILAGVKAGRLDLVQKLLEVMGKTLSDFESLGKYLLWAATRGNQKQVITWLLERGVSVNAFPDWRILRLHSPIQIAASLGNMDMIQFLVAQGADSNFRGRGIGSSILPIQSAAHSGQEEVVNFLLDHGADPVAALECAAHNGQARVIKLLLRRFPDLLSRDGGKIGQSAMVYAIFAKNPTAITVLVEAGVPLNDHHSDSGLPINTVKRCNAPWVVEHLRSLGAHETSKEFCTHGGLTTTREILVTERTWEWVSKY